MRQQKRPYRVETPSLLDGEWVTWSTFVSLRNALRLAWSLQQMGDAARVVEIDTGRVLQHEGEELL